MASLQHHRCKSIIFFIDLLFATLQPSTPVMALNLERSGLNRHRFDSIPQNLRFCSRSNFHSSCCYAAVNAYSVLVLYFEKIIERDTQKLATTLFLNESNHSNLLHITFKHSVHNVVQYTRNTGIQEYVLVQKTILIVIF